MKQILIFCLPFLVVGCHVKSEPREAADSTACVVSLLERGRQLAACELTDSAVGLLLTAADIPDCEPATRYLVLRELSLLYEKKNLFSLQADCQRRMMRLAAEAGDSSRLAEAYFMHGVTLFAMQELDSAEVLFRMAYRAEDQDSTQFLAKCRLMSAQVCLQKNDADSLEFFLREAENIFPRVGDDELYHLTRAYHAYLCGQAEAESIATRYIENDGPYTCIELRRLLMQMHEENGNLSEALADAKAVVELCDTVRIRESAAATARIHALQHESQMQLAAKERVALLARARVRRLWYTLIILSSLLGGTILTLVFRRKYVRARASELEALKLMECALADATETHALNDDLQRRYYEHLYAIILPILNARRTKAGGIDLGEREWQLIEENTDLVLPQFTRKLRRSHPQLSDDDVRFCCMVAMRVPNPILANVYAISPASVSMRKQRIKHKLEDSIERESLENYLNKYSL